jgi:hypothetical protein
VKKNVEDAPFLSRGWIRYIYTMTITMNWWMLQTRNDMKGMMQRRIWVPLLMLIW